MPISKEYQSSYIHPNKILKILINNKYKEAVWVKFDDINNWDFIILKNFQYDFVTDSDIDFCLNHPDLNNVNPHIDWEDDHYLANIKNIKNELKHAMRIASLILEFNKINSSINPIDIDTMAANHCFSSIPNGHHRIRALQYLGYDGFPAYLNGHCSDLDKLRSFKLK
jgi:hypothetical protein